MELAEKPCCLIIHQSHLVPAGHVHFYEHELAAAQSGP